MDEQTKQRLIAAYERDKDLSVLEIHERDHKVGYKSPPLHSRFQKGNPGGPGRPPYGPLYKSLKKALQRRGPALAEEIVDGILDRALKGNPADVRLLVLLTSRHFP